MVLPTAKRIQMCESYVTNTKQELNVNAMDKCYVLERLLEYQCSSGLYFLIQTVWKKKLFPLQNRQYCKCTQTEHRVALRHIISHSYARKGHEEIYTSVPYRADGRDGLGLLLFFSFSLSLDDFFTLKIQ